MKLFNDSRDTYLDYTYGLTEEDADNTDDLYDDDSDFEDAADTYDSDEE